MSDDVDLDFVEEPPPELSEKRQAEVNRESRRRLEQKLEETRLKKQSQDYDFDLD